MTMILRDEFSTPKKLPNEGEQCKQTMQRSLKTVKPWK